MDNKDDTILRLGQKVKNKELTWKEATKNFNDLYNADLSQEAFRKRYRIRVKRPSEPAKVTDTGEYETTYQNGTLEAQKIVEYNKEIFGDKRKLMKYLGYDPNQWEFVFMTTSVWNQHTKEQITKQLYAVKFKLKPLINQITPELAIQSAKELLEKNISTIKLEKVTKKQDIDDDRMILIPQIEAHLGKFSNKIEVGVEYNHEIVKERVRKVFNEAIRLQESNKCGKCLLVVGGDFFNSEPNSQTTGGTPQQNDVRYKEMFDIGLKLYTEGILSLRENFNNVDVMLAAGNHSRGMEFFLYVALQCYFKSDKIVHFVENYRDTQAYIFGDVSLFFNHGDPNNKRLIASIPAEFYKEYGSTKYRYLFLGHLHKLEQINTENGLTVHRVPAVCENDSWHYQNRFGIGNNPAHEILIFDKNCGMVSSNFVYFNKKSKVLSKNKK